jgi:hypothetical protein
MGLEEHSMHFILKLSCIICNVAIWRHVFIQDFKVHPESNLHLFPPIYTLSLSHCSRVATNSKQFNGSDVSNLLPPIRIEDQIVMWGYSYGAVATKRVNVTLVCQGLSKCLLRLNKKRLWNTDCAPNSFTELYVDTSLHNLWTVWLLE